MSRRRPDHSTDMTARSDRNRLRSRRKRRRLARGGIKGLFWLLVMCGVFVLGIGYGRTIGGDESAVGDKVTDRPRGRDGGGYAADEDGDRDDAEGRDGEDTRSGPDDESSVIGRESRRARDRPDR